MGRDINSVSYLEVGKQIIQTRTQL